MREEQLEIANLSVEPKEKKNRKGKKVKITQGSLPTPPAWDANSSGAESETL